MSLQLFDALPAHIEAALRASIERFGVLVPVMVDQTGEMLDGHHRSRIAADLGIEVDTIEVACADEAERAEIARTLNADRRHLTEEQRREVVAALREDGHSTRAIAGAVGVSHTTVQSDLASGGNHLPPERSRGLDGKTYPATRTARDVEPGDTVEDDHGDTRTVTEIDEIDDELVLHDDQGDALITDPEREFTVSKPNLGNGVSHPARFSNQLLSVFAELLDGYQSVLDPFAGTGRVHDLAGEGHDTYGIELEPEWAKLHPDTKVGDARALPYDDERFDAICTSPTYGNRLADHHNAADPEKRRSYTHDLGRTLTEGNSGAMQWGDEYRELHTKAWEEAVRVLRDGGRLVLNIKDHYRDGELQLVSWWHVATLVDIGLEYSAALSRAVAVRSLRQGANGEVRDRHELVLVLEKP